ncbi:polyprenyl synthetase family protein [Micromonospora sp. M12]
MVLPSARAVLALLDGIKEVAGRQSRTATVENCESPDDGHLGSAPVNRAAAGTALTRRLDIRACIDSFDTALASTVRSALAEVETELHRRIVAPGDPWLSEAAGHLIRAGGKRLRPLLVILAAQTGHPDPFRVLRAAVAVELMHVATLHHDDVMDNAMLRHGVPSANARWGNRLAVLVGDHLMAVACMTALEVDTDLVRRQGWTLTRLVHGQATEGTELRVGEDAVEQYLRVASDKSASLFALCGWAGAACGDADEKVSEAIAQYGEALGVAFQISDDLLDIVADTTASGKTRGIDLQKGYVLCRSCTRSPRVIGTRSGSARLWRTARSTIPPCARRHWSCCRRRRDWTEATRTCTGTPPPRGTAWLASRRALPGTRCSA